MTSEVLDKMVQLATAAFGLVAALAWNTAIQAVFDAYFPRRALVSVSNVHMNGDME